MMAREGKAACKRNTRNKIQLERMCSNESDEDYTVGEDEEFDESEDEYCSSLAADEIEESLELEDEEEEEECAEKKIRNIGRPRGGNSFQQRSTSGVAKPIKKKAAYSEEREDYDDDNFAGAKRRKRSMSSHIEKEDNNIRILYWQGVDDTFGEKLRKKTRLSCTGKYMDHFNEKPRKTTNVSYREENEDDDYDEPDEDDDEEFTPDEVDGIDDDEELPVTRKNKMEQEAQKANGKKRKRNAKALKRTKRKKPIKEQVLRRNNGYCGKEFRDESSVVRKKKKITEKGRGTMKSSANSDSDFESSGLSDYEYTISEEEREQVREASEFCKMATTNSGNSSSLKVIEEEEIVPSRRKHKGRKGKEKVVDIKLEVRTQVCGICLSEEEKGTVRGILNCCSHYFCFACIMEWSKVESRCPLCKQRFITISRASPVHGGHGKDDVIQVPERDQVYQPSEEELRGYLDPYENVICFECHEGGDDAFMLLCDLCDSPAHTYCVGLGREVPEGNWYCDGCRSTALAYSDAQALDPTPGHEANNNLSVGTSDVGTVRETFDLNELYVPETPSTQVTGHSPSPIYSFGVTQAPSPAFGLGALTLNERRRIQRQIHQLLSNRSRQSERSDGLAPVSGNSLLPETPSTQFIGHSPSPRYSVGDSQASPAFGPGAITLNERRRIHRQIHQHLSNRSRQSERSDSLAPVSGISLLPETPSTQLTGHSQSPRQSERSDGLAPVSGISLLRETPSTQLIGHFPSRYSVGYSQASPAFGPGPITLNERRRIHRQIHQHLNNRIRQSERSDGLAPVSGISLFGSQVFRDGLMAPRHAVPVQVLPQSIYHQGRLPDYTSPGVYDREVLSPRSSSLRGQVFHQASTSMDHSFDGPSQSEFSGTNASIDQGFGNHQLHPCNSGSNTRADSSISTYQSGEASVEKEQVQSMVKSHLKSLSSNLDLGYTTFKYIARTATHTILAAIGNEHRWSEVYPVRTRPLICDHFDRFAGQHTYPIAGQCSSCFNCFIRDVVREIMSTKVPLLSTY